MKVEVVGFRKAALSIGAFIIGAFAFAQDYISEGRIVFERRTNLEKRYAGMEKNRWMRNADLSKPKIDEFELLFTKDLSVFKPVESDVRDERSWFTMSNLTAQDFINNVRKQEFNIMGTAVNLEDEIKERTWRMTESTRTIAGYECRQALWIANDTVRIYAWYAEELLISTGPETFNGLPGTILGLAIEDGGIVYFAKEVEKKTVQPEEYIPKARKKDIYTEESLRNLINDRFSSYGSMVEIYKTDMFTW